jgi:hypothetical protein
MTVIRLGAASSNPLVSALPLRRLSSRAKLRDARLTMNTTAFLLGVPLPRSPRLTSLSHSRCPSSRVCVASATSPTDSSSTASTPLDEATRVSPVAAATVEAVPAFVTRRSLLVTAATIAAVTASLSGRNIRTANATVAVDVDRYGDKELKVSAINSIKQNCRNILQARPELLPSFFALNLHDALSYDAETGAGGPNGTLRLELDRPENAELHDAVQALTDARAISRKDMSYADTFAFAGAVAVEVTGGPRIVVQLGRDDANEPSPEGGNAALYRPGATAPEAMAAFKGAGLDAARDVVLMHGGYGSLATIAEARLAKLAADKLKSGEDDDDDEFGNSTDDVTYGKVKSKKRGPVLVSSNVSNLTLGGAKFSNSYLKYMLDSKKKGKEAELSDRDRALLSNPETLSFVEQYAANNGKFCTDVADLYEKVSLLGVQYENLRMADTPPS